MSIFTARPLFLPFGVFVGTAPFTVGAHPFAATVYATINLIRWSQAVFINPPLDAANFWTISLALRSPANVETLIASYVINSGVSTWQINQTTSFSVNPVIPASFPYIGVRIMNTGAPGSCFPIGPILEISV